MPVPGRSGTVLLGAIEHLARVEQPGSYAVPFPGIGKRQAVDSPNFEREELQEKDLRSGAAIPYATFPSCELRGFFESPSGQVRRFSSTRTGAFCGQLQLLLILDAKNGRAVNRPETGI